MKESGKERGVLKVLRLECTMLRTYHIVWLALNCYVYEQEDMLHVCGTFLDLRKAFDFVPHSPLIELLASLIKPSRSTQSMIRKS